MDFRNQMAYTLIELMIVIAIISVLASIAMPLFSSYRVRAFNSAAISDIRNISGSQSAFYTGLAMYGATEGAANSAACTGSANRTGTVLKGGQGAGILPFISSQDPLGNQVALSIGLSRNNSIFVTTAQQTSPSDMYSSQSKHISGNLVYGIEHDSIDLFQNQALYGIGDSLTVASEVSPTAADDYKLASGGGWTVK